MEEKYGGFGGGLTAAGLGALRGASLGLSDPLITGIGGERARQALQGYEETNPTASLAGEVGGVVVPAIFTGGEGAVGTAAKFASAPVRALSAVGRGAESAVARVVGREAESVLGRVAQRALSSGAGMALEGAAYGVGHEISDAAIHDHELTAEKLWAGAGQGALIGGLTGAAAGTVGQLGREAIAGVGKITKSPSVSAFLDKMSAERAFGAANPGKRIARQAERAGGFENVGRTWRDEAPGLVGKDNFGQLNREDLAVAAEKGLEREGSRIVETLDAADAKAIQAGKIPRAMDVVGDIDRVADKLRVSQLGSKPAADRLLSISDDLQRMMGLVDDAGQLLPGAGEARMSLRQLHEVRKMADKAIGPGTFGPELSGFKDQMLSVRRALEDRLENAVQDAGGEKLAAVYKDAKSKAQAFYLLRDATKNATAGAGANRFFGLSEQLGGLVGSQVGGLVGGPIGSMIGTGAGSLVSHAVKTRGDFVAASLLKHVSQLGAIEKATALVDNRITAGVRGFLSKGTSYESPVARRPKVEPVAEKTQARALVVAQKVTDLAQNDGARQEYINSRIGDLGMYAPSVTAHAALRATQSIFNLAANAPKASFNAHSLTQGAEKLRYSPAQVYDFSRYLSGFEEPLSVLDDMKGGKLDRLKLQAVQENHPRIYEQMYQEMQQAIAVRGDELTWEQKQVAKTFFGIPADDAQDPDFIKRLQQSAEESNQAPQPEEPGAQGGGRRPIDTDVNPYLTSTDQLMTPQ
jgi:hypothetical protein